MSLQVLEKSPSIVDRLEGTAFEFTYRVGYQIIVTLNNSFLFVLALQTNDLLRVWLDGQTFDAHRLGVIFTLILLVIFISYIKERYESLHEINTSSSNIAKNIGKHAYNHIHG